MVHVGSATGCCCQVTAGAGKRACGEPGRGSAVVRPPHGSPHHPPLPAHLGSVVIFHTALSGSWWAHFSVPFTAGDKAARGPDGEICSRRNAASLTRLITGPRKQTAAATKVHFPAWAPNGFSILVWENLSQGSTTFWGHQISLNFCAASLLIQWLFLSPFPPLLAAFP